MRNCQTKIMSSVMDCTLDNVKFFLGRQAPHTRRRVLNVVHDTVTQQTPISFHSRIRSHTKN